MCADEKGVSVETLSLPRIHRSAANRAKKLRLTQTNFCFLDVICIYLEKKEIAEFFACVPSGVVRVQAVVGGGLASLRAPVVELARLHHALAIPVHLFPQGGRLHANQHWKVGGSIFLP